MALLSSVRSIGVIGSILALLIVVPGTGTVLAVIGWILVLIAVQQLSHLVGDRSILNNMLIATVLAIVGIVVGIVTALDSFIRFAGLNGITVGFFTAGMSSGPFMNVSTFHGLGPLIVGVLVGLGILWLFLLVGAFFLRRSYARLAAKLNAKWFGTAALVFLIGAALTIIGVGLIIVFIAEIVQAYAFFTIPDVLPGQAERPVPMTVPPPPPPVA